MKDMKKELLEIFLKDFKGVNKINSGSYGINLWSGEDFSTRFEKELEKELEKDENDYPLIERVVNAFNNSLLKN